MHGLKWPINSTRIVQIPSFAEVLQSGCPHEQGLSSDGKAGCIVRSEHTNWNMVRDGSVVRRLNPEEEEVLMGFPAGYTAAQLEEECHVAAPVVVNNTQPSPQQQQQQKPREQQKEEKQQHEEQQEEAEEAEEKGRWLSSRERHQLIGNSFSVHVVAQLLEPLRALGECAEEQDAAAAVAALKLRGDGGRAGGRAAKKWCSECESAACCWVH